MQLALINLNLCVLLLTFVLANSICPICLQAWHLTSSLKQQYFSKCVVFWQCEQGGHFLVPPSFAIYLSLVSLLYHKFFLFLDEHSSFLPKRALQHAPLVYLLFFVIKHKMYWLTLTMRCRLCLLSLHEIKSSSKTSQWSHTNIFHNLFYH